MAKPIATLQRNEAAGWCDYAAYLDEQGAFIIDGKRVRIESVYDVPHNLQPRWLVGYYSDTYDIAAVHLMGARPFNTKDAEVYGWK